MPSIHQLISLQGKTAIITGSVGHLGQAISNTIAELKGNLILIDLNPETLSEQKQRLSEKWQVNIQTISCDLESESERNSLLKKLHTMETRPNILINNAAYIGPSNLEGWSTQFEKQSIDTWRRALEVNLTAIFHLCQGLAGQLQNGCIINVASIHGALGPVWKLYENTDMANPAAYAASKGGLIQLTRWLATTLAPDVRVNAISPGGIYRNHPPQFVERYVERTPLGRMAKEEDICGSIAFLASDMASYVTGQNIFVDGGWSTW